MVSKYKAIIFDWDGTLVDSTQWVLDAHNHVRANMGMALWTMEDIFGSSSFSTRELYPQIYGDNADKAIKLLFDYTNEYNLDGATPYELAEEMLQFLKKQQKPIAVVSNKRHEPLNEMVDHLGWREYFHSVIGAGHTERDKPHPSSLLKAIAEIDMALTPSDILYVGDTETDLLTAQNTGCDVALIQSDKPRPELLNKYKPSYVYDDLGEFYEAVTVALQQPNIIKAC